MRNDEKALLMNLLLRFRGARLIDAADPIVLLTPNEIESVESCIEEARAREREEESKAQEQYRKDAEAELYAEQKAKEAEERIRAKEEKLRLRPARKATKKGARKRARR